MPRHKKTGRERFTLRIPAETRQTLVEQAAAEGIDTGDLILDLIAEALPEHSAVAAAIATVAERYNAPDALRIAQQYVADYRRRRAGRHWRAKHLRRLASLLSRAAARLHRDEEE